DEYIHLAYESMYEHVQLMMELQRKGAITFDYGNNIRARALECEQKYATVSTNIDPSKKLWCISPKGEANSLFPGFVPAYIRPLFCEGKGPFRWVALSGDPEDIAVTDKVIAEMFPE